MYVANIRVMDEILANKIAAGEVVERIVSIVKELVENSIDAKSDEIKIELIGENITYNNADILDRAFSILMHAQASYDLKCQLWDVVQNPSFWTTLVTTEEHEHLLNALKEIINLRNLSK